MEHSMKVLYSLFILKTIAVGLGIFGVFITSAVSALRQERLLAKGVQKY